MSDDITDAFLVGKDGVQFDPTNPLPEVAEEAIASMLADGMSQKTIAKTRGTTQAAVAIFIREHPAVDARARYLREMMTNSLVEHGAINRLNRLAKYQDMLDNLERITAQRARAALEDAQARLVPGADSGMLVRQVKSIRTDGGMERIEEWVFDKAVFNAAMEVTERIARESGQWTEKKETQQETVVRVFHTDGDIAF